MNKGILEIKLSSAFGVLIFYYMLMDSSFPFNDQSTMLDFFYWSKFIVSLLIIMYVFFFTCKGKLRKYSGDFKFGFYYVSPWVVMLLYSCFVWGIEKTAVPYITRGISNFLANVLPIMLGVAMVMLYKKRSYNLLVVAVCLMACTNYIVGIIVNGPIFIVQLFNIDCVESTYLKYKELHEISYIIGLLLLYYINCGAKDLEKKWIVFLVLVFFFSWKRIGILAFFVSLGFLEFQKIIRIKRKNVFINVCGIIGVFLCLIYVYLSVNSGLSKLLGQFGINMMGRDVLYSYFRRFCVFSISFLGLGIGFVSRQFNYLTWDDVGEMSLLKQGLHNDFYSLFLEIGMVGYFIWLLYQLVFLPRIVYKTYGKRASFTYFSFIIYSFVTYTTDNTLRYFVYQMSFIILVYLVLFSRIVKTSVMAKDG